MCLVMCVHDRHEPGLAALNSWPCAFSFLFFSFCRTSCNQCLMMIKTVTQMMWNIGYWYEMREFSLGKSRYMVPPPPARSDGLGESYALCSFSSLTLPTSCSPFGPAAAGGECTELPITYYCNQNCIFPEGSIIDHHLCHYAFAQMHATPLDQKKGFPLFWSGTCLM